MTSAPVRRFVWQNTPAPAVAQREPGLRHRRVAVLGDLEQTVAAVSAELAAHGAHPWHVGDGGFPDAVVDLTLAEPFDPDRPDATDGALTRTLTVLRHCYDDWAAETDARRLAYLAITYLGGHSGYHTDVHASPVHQPLGGIWAGLAKTLHRELPNAHARVVDVDRPDTADLPGIVAAELYASGPAECGYVDGVRHVLVPRPSAVAAEAVSLGQEDVVLVCGGGSGIGFDLATTLALRHGCEVVITGRASPPHGCEEWARLDETAFEAYRHELLRQAAADGTVRDTRRRLGRLNQLRQLHTNLRAVEAAGLRLRYRRCDHTDPGDLARLVTELGPRLFGVVYISGVDRPARLPAKSDADFLAGVAVKVTGFLRVFAAVRHRNLKFFCNAGSLVGRLGGMVGELDYAAGNEALARLGQWAAQSSGLDVLTVCWPLWAGRSVSPNVDAALKYMPAMDPAEGLDRWCAELAAPHVREAAFVGPIADGISLTQAGQCVVEPALPGFGAVYPRIFHRGDPVEWRPGQRLVSTVVFTADTAPVAGDFVVGGSPALPVSILLENALRSGEWLLRRTIRELSDIEVDTGGLRLAGGRLELRRYATVERDHGDHGDDAGISVVFRGSTGDPVVRLTARCHGHPVGEPTSLPTSAGEPVPADSTGLRWRGLTVPVAQWRRHYCGTLTAAVATCAAADLWAAEPAPSHFLPIAALENVLRMALAGRESAEGRLRIRRIAWTDEPGSADVVVGAPSGDTWHVLDRHTARAWLVLQSQDRLA